ncbi:MAG: hypothetical protein JW804_08975 [Sedimentisphaerales bacterium]|nr:hypothetical protein [Sedimentisphaerales bacterium]
MKVLVQANLLTVGLNGKAEILQELPICLYIAESAAGAISLLRDVKVEGVFSKWHLEDMPDGLFLRKLKTVKPSLATIVMVRGDNPTEEIRARSMGVSAVLTERCSDKFLLETVSQALGVELPEKARALLPSGKS